MITRSDVAAPARRMAGRVRRTPVAEVDATSFAAAVAVVLCGANTDPADLT